MRGKQAKKRKLTPDAMYGSVEVTRFINYIMQDGKKSVARAIVYGALEKLGEETKMKPLEAFTKALGNVKPKMEVRSRRVGGANYQVPVPVTPARQESLAMRWIIQAMRDGRKDADSATTLYRELSNAFKKEGLAFKKKEETHRMAEANKAFAHFQW